MRAAGLLLSAAVLLVTGVAQGKATIIIQNGDPPGSGLNDPTVVAPVGGNPGTTLGAQRLAVFQEAARIWGDALDSAVPISVLAHFQPLSCDSARTVLGMAGPSAFVASDPPSPGGGPSPTDAGPPNSAFPRQSTWYVPAEVARFAGQQLSSGTGTDSRNFDIVATFNSTLDTNPAACNGFVWYYGLDNQHAEKDDLLTVVLHELGHGLGFLTFTDESTGGFQQNIPDIWSYFLYDDSTGKHWNELDAAGRAASAISGQLTWDGPAVKAAVPSTLKAALLLRVTSAPAAPSVVKDYTSLALAQFSAQIGTTPVSGPLGAASTRWACSSGGRLAPLDGKIAIADRGGPSPDAGCTFVEKARNAQDAGAIALLIANNTTGLTTPSGTAPDITIPVLLVTQVDGQMLEAAADAGTVAASILRDPKQGFAGADTSQRALLYAPSTVLQGSSVSHWDGSASPDLLMEPSLSPALTHGLDLTVPLLRDIGWFLVDLAVTGTGPSTVASGQEGTFTFTVTNPGPSPAAAVTVRNSLSGLTFVSNAGDCTTAFPCALGDLAPGVVKTITTTLKASSSNSATTTATVVSDSNYNATNDVATVTVNAGAGGGGGGCSAPFGPPTPWLALAGLLAFARRKRPAPPRRR